MSEITLEVNGVRYAGWKEASVNKSLDQFCGEFSVTGSVLSDWGMPSDWPIKMGDLVKVSIDGMLLLFAWVEDFPGDYDANSHNLYIAGRELTCDLVDCSYIDSRVEWTNTPVRNIVSDLCKGFPGQIQPVWDSSADEAASKKMTKFVINQGDTIHSTILTLGRMWAFMAVSLGDGMLTLTRAGTATAADSIELGRNAKRARSRQSNRDRYSQYIVKGQHEGMDDSDTAITTHPTATAYDTRILHYRPLLVTTDTATTADMCRRRADWEARTRAGASREIQYDVQGWRQQPGGEPGELWALNQLVRVKDPVLGVDDKWLINGLSFGIRDGEGETTQITVCPPQKYDLLEEGEPPGDAATGLDW